MNNPLKKLIDMLHDSDDLIMAIEGKLDTEGKKMLKEADSHLDEAYKVLKRLQTKVVFSNIVKRYSNKLKQE